MKSQISLEGNPNFRDITNTYLVRQGNTTVNIKDVEGSQFLNDEFQYGFIIDIDQNNKAKTFLRYNVYKDVFEIKFDLNSESLKQLERLPKYQYKLNNEKFVLIQDDIINDQHYISGNGYVVELTPPKDVAVLYKRYYKKLYPGRKAQSSYQKDKPPRMKDGVKYIIKFGDEFKIAEDHRKRILDAFPDHKKEIRKYIKDKKFKFRGDDKEIQNQMIQVVRYYNSLVD
jgi:hypothetical protein